MVGISGVRVSSDLLNGINYFAYIINGTGIMHPENVRPVHNGYRASRCSAPHPLLGIGLVAECADKAFAGYPHQ
jgi:hypothetical protein